MAALSSVVVVNVVVQSAGISRTGFGTPLLLARTNAFSSPYRIYNKLADMTSDGLSAAILAAGAAVFGQVPRPTQLIVGRMTASVAQPMKIKLTPNADLPGNTVHSNTAYVVTINGTPFTYTSDSTATAPEISAGLTALINANGPLPVTATDNVGNLDLTADVAGNMFTLSVDRHLLLQENITAPLVVSPGADLSAIQVFTDDFYCVIPVEFMSKADLKLLATAVSGMTKMIMLATADDEVYLDSDTDNLATGLSALPPHKRISLMYHPDAYNSFPNAAWAGNQLPLNPGASTWALKTLQGVSATDLNATEIGILNTRKCNYYTSIASRSVTLESVTTVSATDFIDTTRDIDFLTERMKEEIFGALVASNKVPYTSAGLAVVESAMRGVLQLCVNQGILSPDVAFVINIPDIATVSPIDKAARIVTTINFTAALSGAIHKVIPIQGTVTV